MNPCTAMLKCHSGPPSTRQLNWPSFSAVKLRPNLSMVSLDVPLKPPGHEKGAWKQTMAATAEERLKKIIAEQLSVSEDEVTPEANFIDDLNADSLDLVELIMSLEEEFNVKISDEDAEKIRTVQDAMDYLHEHGGA